MLGKMIFVFVIVISLIFVFTSCGTKSTEASDRCATPQFSPGEDTYNSVQTVSITCATSDAAIYYTTDGTTPSSSSNLYAEPIQINVTTTLKAIAIKEDLDDSHIATATYTIDLSNMVRVAGGTYNNGTSEVTVSTFYISKYEVKQSEYQAIMGSNPSLFITVTDGPVEQVTWFNAIEYCNRRSMIESLTPCYSYGTYGTNPSNWPEGWNAAEGNHTNVSCNWSAKGYRLPTEGEWYYAALGGNQTHNYMYSGSNTIDDVAWYSGNSLSSTHPIGSKAANELGLYDMTGNVSEWAWDIYAILPIEAQTNPHGPTTGTNRCIRGANWSTNAYYSNMIYRYYYISTMISSHIGIRLCRHTL